MNLESLIVQKLEIDRLSAQWDEKPGNRNRQQLKKNYIQHKCQFISALWSYLFWQFYIFKSQNNAEIRPGGMALWTSHSSQE
jgi:hypothetical protein